MSKVSTCILINYKTKQPSNLAWNISLTSWLCDIGVHFSVHLSVRLSTFMSKFDIYVKVSILINYKTKQLSNLAWNISLTSWLCDIGARFSVVCPSVCKQFCRSSTFMSVSILINYKTEKQSNLAWNIPLTSWLHNIGIRFSVCLSICLSTFMSKFNIYVKVSIVINYKTEQPSNLAWNISLTSWLCDIGVRFSIHLSVRPSVRLSTFMTKFNISVKVNILINYKTKQPSKLAWNISLTSWLCDIGIPFSIRPSVCPSINVYLEVRHLRQS